MPEIKNFDLLDRLSYLFDLRFVGDKYVVFCVAAC